MTLLPYSSILQQGRLPPMDVGIIKKYFILKMVSSSSVV